MDPMRLPSELSNHRVEIQDSDWENRSSKQSLSCRSWEATLAGADPPSELLCYYEEVPNRECTPYSYSSEY